MKDLTEAEQRIIAYQEEIDNMQSEFMWSDSIKQAELYRLATELKSFESQFEDENLKLTINGIIAGVLNASDSEMFLTLVHKSTIEAISALVSSSSAAIHLRLIIHPHVRFTSP